jgi:hypothetical protein
MKKVLTAGVAVLAILTLAACGSNSSDSATVSSLKAENSSLKKEVAGTTKTTEAVKLPKSGVVQYTITSVKTEHVANKKENYTDGEDNLSAVDNFPAHYYRTTISYEAKNFSSKSISLSTSGGLTVTDGDGHPYSRDSQDYAAIEMNDNVDVPAGESYSGVVYALSKRKPNFKTFKWMVPEMNAEDKDGNAVILSKATTVEYKQ